MTAAADLLVAMTASAVKAMAENGAMADPGGSATPDGRFATGCDIVDIARLSAALDRRAGLLARLFTDREIADARRGGAVPGSTVERARLAARFAAKEATRKALGDLRLPFHAVEVRATTDGAPHLWVDGRPSELACSLSHDAGLAMAVVVGPAVAPATGTGPGPTAGAAR